jgi:hypothetical protein
MGGRTTCHFIVRVTLTFFKGLSDQCKDCNQIASIKAFYRPLYEQAVLMYGLAVLAGNGLVGFCLRRQLFLTSCDPSAV